VTCVHVLPDQGWVTRRVRMAHCFAGCSDADERAVRPWHVGELEDHVRAPYSRCGVACQSAADSGKHMHVHHCWITSTQRCTGALLFDPHSVNTKDNAKAALLHLACIGGRECSWAIRVITNDWHMPRAILAFKSAWRSGSAKALSEMCPECLSQQAGLHWRCPLPRSSTSASSHHFDFWRPPRQHGCAARAPMPTCGWRTSLRLARTYVCTSNTCAPRLSHLRWLLPCPVLL